MSVNINVTTTGTPVAGKQIADFTNQSAAGLIAMAKAAQQASAGTEAAREDNLLTRAALLGLGFVDGLAVEPTGDLGINIFFA